MKVAAVLGWRSRYSAAPLALGRGGSGGHAARTFQRRGRQHLRPRRADDKDAAEMAKVVFASDIAVVPCGDIQEPPELALELFVGDDERVAAVDVGYLGRHTTTRVARSGAARRTRHAAFGPQLDIAAAHQPSAEWRTAPTLCLVELLREPLAFMARVGIVGAACSL